VSLFPICADKHILRLWVAAHVDYGELLHIDTYCISMLLYRILYSPWVRAVPSSVQVIGPHRDAVVWLSPVWGEISPNLEPDFGSSSQIFVNPNLNLREPDFGSSSGSSRV